MQPIAPRGGTWQVGHGRRLELGPRATIMGILNFTPDSFSDGGRYAGVEEAVNSALAMLAEGAEIIDIGGESTRPGATPVDPLEEQRRVLPVIEALAARSDCLISIDTYRAETARLAIAAGAHIVNDVWGAQKEPEIARVAASAGSGICLMHNGRERTRLPDMIDDQRLFLNESLRIAAQAGIEPGAIVLDPGFGFEKDGPENMILMARFGEIMDLGFPLLVGTSRKRFVRGIIGRNDPEPDVATAATSVLMRERGADIFRVHNVPVSRDALAIADAMFAAAQGAKW